MLKWQCLGPTSHYVATHVCLGNIISPVDLSASDLKQLAETGCGNNKEHNLLIFVPESDTLRVSLSLSLGSAYKIES